MAKGGNFQWVICKLLSKWWTHGKRDDIFCPTSESGGRNTTRLKKGITTENSAGDVAYLDAIGKPLIGIACIEIKRGYSNRIKYLNIIDSTSNKKSPIVLKWWKKLLKEAHSVNRPFPIMIFKRDYKNPCIITDNKFLSTLENYNGEFPGNIILLNIKNTSIMYTLSFNEFINWCNPHSIEMIFDEVEKECMSEISGISKDLKGSLKKIKRRK